MTKTYLLSLSAILLAICTVGCESQVETSTTTLLPLPAPMDGQPYEYISQANNHFTVEGLPLKQYMVGGGVMVEFNAPTDGTLYWVEETGRKIMMTKYLKMGDFFGEALPIDNADFRNLLGDMSSARFVLYFIPASVLR
ncbi:MAG: hypothetical protein GXY41_10000 [Phycisphaerae bacterium]|mgnify:CR=1 FL=1|nr:hypothetical protein [Phycisphaerae bacterium]